MFIAVSFRVWVSPGYFFVGSGMEFEVQPNRYDPRSLILAFLPDRRILDIAGVQGYRHEAGPSLGARVPGHPVQTPGRFVERVAGLVLPDRLVVDGVLVLALQDVAERRAGMALRRILLTGPESHFVHHRTGNLPV